VACSLLLIVLLLVPAARVPAQGGLIGYWAFDRAGADTSGRGRNLTLAGGIGIGAGLFGQALDLHHDGSQFATRPVDDPIYDFGNGQFTVQVWVNFNNTGGEQVLIEKFLGGTGPGWTLTKLPDDSLHFYADPTIILTSAPLNITTGVWHHIVARRSGSLFQVLYDGDVVTEGSASGAIPDTEMPLLVGKRNDLDLGSVESVVDGRIDEIAIWSQGLSNSEIATLFNGGNGNRASSVQSNLIGYWTFDGGGADLSGGQRNLDLTGGVGIASGLFAQAMDFHNDNSRFASRPIDDSVYDFGENDFTVQVWVNFNSTAGEQVLIEKFLGGTGPGWTLTKLEGDSLHFFADPTIALTSDPLNMTTGVWHHIVVRRSGTVFQILYDGNVVAEGSNSGAIPDTDMPLLVGKRNDLDGGGFAVDGRIDEVAVWSRALPDDDVALLFNGGSGILATSLGAMQVAIDIKPSAFPNAVPDVDTLNLGAQGALPVAVLSGGTFNAATVDQSTVMFAGAPPTRSAAQDVDGDGDSDLLLHFATQALILSCSSNQVVLTAATTSGTWVVGTDSIRVLRDKDGRRCP
jgi:hypothetical protein